MRYTLRPATDADYDALYRLHEATMRATVEQVWGWDYAGQARFFRERWNPADRQVIVVDGRDAGVLSVERRPHEVWLANIEIAPEFQGRGLGTAIIGDLLREAHGRGVHVALQVNRANPARRLYERLGFIETGRTETHYLMEAPPRTTERRGQVGR